MSDLAIPAFRHVQPAPLGSPPDAKPARHPAETNHSEPRESSVPPAKASPQDNRLTGPPPAFETNLLDLTHDIDALIRDIEAARQSAREAYELLPTSDSHPAQALES